MPYIIQANYAKAAAAPSDVGELNFKLTYEIIGYIQRKGLRYQNINDIMGATSAAAAFVAGVDSFHIRDFADLELPFNKPDNATELAATLSKIVSRYVVDMKPGSDKDYSNYQVQASGAATAAGAEFYRRVAVPYEQKKIAENGDVYPPELVS